MPFSVASTLEKHMRKCVAGGKKPGLPPPHWAAGDEDGDDDDGGDDDDDGGGGDDGVDRQLVRMGYRLLVRGCKGL